MPTSSELRTTAIKKYSDFKKVFVKIFLEVLGKVNSKNIINMNYIYKQIFCDTKYFLLFYIKKASGSLFLAKSINHIQVTQTIATVRDSITKT